MTPSVEKTHSATSDILRPYQRAIRIGVWLTFIIAPIQLAIGVRMLTLHSGKPSTAGVALSLALSSRVAFWFRTVLRETKPRVARWLAVCGYALLFTAAVCAIAALR